METRDVISVDLLSTISVDNAVDNSEMAQVSSRLNGCLKISPFLYVFDSNDRSGIDGVI